MTYRAPVADISFTLNHAAGFAQAQADGLYGDLSADVVEAVLTEAGRFANDILAPLNVPGDREGAHFRDGAVTTPPGWKEAYQAWAKGGWNAVAAPAQWGGQELPHALNAACLEMWNSAAMAFGLGPVLTMAAAIDALVAHGSDALQRAYLPKLVSGEWMGTMQLTEPQAGSDVGALRTRAERMADGSYRLTGQKIFITYASTISPTTSSIWCWRGCLTRRRERRACRSSSCQNSCPIRTARSVSETMSVHTRSSTSSVFTPRRPVPWSMATAAAPPVLSSARRTTAWPACSP